MGEPLYDFKFSLPAIRNILPVEKKNASYRKLLNNVKSNRQTSQIKAKGLVKTYHTLIL